jgi:hypothetical protein
VAGTCEYSNEPSIGFHKMRGVSCLPEDLLASQECLLFGVSELVS